MLRLFWCVLLLSIPSLLLAQAKISDLRIENTKNITTLRFILDKKTLGHLEHALKPDRLVINLKQSKLYFKPNFIHLNHPLIQNIDVSTFKSDQVRVVVYLKKTVRWEIVTQSKPQGFEVKVSLIPLHVPQYHRAPLYAADYLLAEIKDAMAQAKPEKKPLKPSTSNLAKGKQIDLVKDSIKPIKKNSVFTLVIDPGHGGKDPGAKGRYGYQEKDIVLKVAKILAEELSQNPNIKVILTRRADVFIPLRGRLQVARQANADLFVAIHADAYFETRATGASVYAVSPRGASSEAARWLAQQENYSELGDVSLNALQDRSPMLRSVLIDLAQNATIRDSIQLGSQILTALNKVTPLHHAVVEQAPFVVLKSPDIPSVLVEIGFVTNPWEEKKISRYAFQTQLARALSQGLKAYYVSKL